MSLFSLHISTIWQIKLRHFEKKQIMHQWRK